MVMRISGLASGMDIDDIVSKLMKTERVPLDKLTQKKQLLEWQRDSYREINTKIKEMQESIYTMLRPSTYGAKKVVSSNESAVTATATTGSASSTIQVNRLATAATYKSSDISGYTGSDQTLTFQVTAPGETTAKKVEISVSSTDTLDDIVSKINKSGLGVSAIKDKIYNGTEYVETIALTSKTTGAGGSIQADDAATASFMTDQLGFALDADNKLTASQVGENAEVVINGLQMEKTSNNFTVNNVTYQLKNTTTSPVSIDVSTDVDGIYEKIKDFVTQYNELIDMVNGKLVEKKYRDYTPLSDEQKEDMTEKQIELWEEKAKSGLLRNDTILSGATNQMRTDFYSNVSVNGESLQLTQFGISTSSVYSQRGHLEINEEKLKAKIKEDPDSVANLFMAGTSSTENYNEKGIMRRLQTVLTNTKKQIEGKAGNSTMANNQFSIGKNLNTVESDILSMNDRLTQIENRYYTKFTAMEKAIQKANEQSTYLLQMLGQ
ncbi:MULTISPECIES: flagellar hook-associated protein 2 [Bacillus]|uniref:flagellar hook-associated protein 2 n=1 Tax=Bacillus TaxID=1386 RepID=UPI002244C7A4|nr:MULTISPECIES: flagellar hook-associated protein 2 [Bacillus]MDN5388944.1 flagellar hook-associated protein 2 [Bacillus sp. LB7]MEC1023461.1 flagellar hook-associated protein 2 [Bacillus paralicheniformis]MEC1027944.1 flagellar hook-associated protein 2 [Bacillus paralicheniformis]MEC1034293.1 flagellar hook-associated protein 2 [Bacillus paralicheniformis]MEC1050325.1 flagellar hook-associated protein 2 [Bacillus paralicheniformis]